MLIPWNRVRPEDLDDHFELQDLAEKMGMGAVRYLLETWGRKEIYLPSELDLSRGGPITEIAEDRPDLAAYLVDEWGGMYLYVPKPESVGRPAVERSIADRYDGENEGELTREYGVSRKWVEDRLSELAREFTREVGKQAGWDVVEFLSDWEDGS